MSQIVSQKNTAMFGRIFNIGLKPFASKERQKIIWGENKPVHSICCGERLNLFEKRC